MTQPQQPPLPDRNDAKLVADLLRRTVLLVTGKGGVGKSTVAATLARVASKQGKRVLLIELEAVSRAAPLFNTASIGPQPTFVAPNLAVMCLHSEDSLRYFFTQQLKIETLVNLALRNRAVDNFFKAVPAIKPMLFLYHLWRLESEHGPQGDRTWDLIVCDLPTSGFVAGMFAIPRTLATVFRLGPIANYADGMRDMLIDPARSGLILVTLPEEMPVVETLELQQNLTKRFGVQIAAIVLNGLYPQLFSEDDLARLALDPSDPWHWAAQLLCGRRMRAETLLPQLREAAPNRLLMLPFLFRRELPLQAIDELAVALSGGAA